MRNWKRLYGFCLWDGAFVPVSSQQLLLQRLCIYSYSYILINLLIIASYIYCPFGPLGDFLKEKTLLKKCPPTHKEEMSWTWSSGSSYRYKLYTTPHLCSSLDLLSHHQLFPCLKAYIGCSLNAQKPILFPSSILSCTLLPHPDPVSLPLDISTIGVSHKHPSIHSAN